MIIAADSGIICISIVYFLNDEMFRLIVMTWTIWLAKWDYEKCICGEVAAGKKPIVRKLCIKEM